MVIDTLIFSNNFY